MWFTVRIRTIKPGVWWASKLNPVSLSQWGGGACRPNLVGTAQLPPPPPPGPHGPMLAPCMAAAAAAARGGGATSCDYTTYVYTKVESCYRETRTHARTHGMYSLHNYRPTQNSRGVGE